ncbi:MAG: radical SAM protein [Actinobacteria bacterium]|nr:radical SAM protein [Actinomycetota bacterium]
MTNNQVLLINSNLIKPPVAPLGLDYVGSIIIRNGFNVELLDLNFSENIEYDIRKKLTNNSFLAIGLNIRNTDDCYYLSQDFFLPKIRDIVAVIRKYSDSPIILGGGGFSVVPLEIIKYLKADYGIIGDGEITFLRLLDSIRNSKKNSDISENIKGVVFKVSDYKIMEPGYYSLKEYPLPDRDLADNKRYFIEGGMGAIETKRGCYRKCIYCADPLIKGSNIRVRPINTVTKEIKNLIDKGINYIHFCDSEFNLPIDYSTNLLNQIIDTNIGDKIKWYSYMSPVPFNENFAKLLKHAGCEGINFGVDSANPKILKNLGRNHTLDDLANVAKLCSKYKIKFMFDLLLGGPGEYKDSIKYTIDNIKKLNPTCVGISYGIRVYPGTYLASIINREFFPNNKNLYGNVKDNTNFFKPIFYISEEIGKDIVEYTNSLVSGDKRFFIGATDNSDKNYNYNENLRLQEAIKNGYRGAFWDILQQINF